MLNSIRQYGLCSDEEAIRKILDGEQAIFEILIRRYNALLYKIARSYGFHHEDAQDLVQESHVAAFRALAKFESRASYKTWISKIMIHQCLNKLNLGYVKNEIPASEQINEEALPVHASSLSSSDPNKRELSKMIEYSLQNIPESYRTVFVLREVEGFSVAETAELLDITGTNVKVRLNRAKAMLQKQLERVYTSADIYEFNLVFCDEVVKKVFEKINKNQL